MRDNRGEWSAMGIASDGNVPLFERLFTAAIVIAQSAVDIVWMLGDRIDRYRSRQDLLDLSDEHLRDVGLTRRQAEREGRRPFFED